MRYFFVALGLFSVFIALVAFVPEYVRMAIGTFPIAWPLHVHGALMAAWLATFILQAILASTGRVALHRKIGPYGFALGVAVWASMVFVELRALVAHPLPTDGRGYDELLQGPYIYLTFAVLLFWAFRERRRPEWHKRLMVIATFVALVAPIERIEWLPELGVGYIWASMIWMDLCLIIPLLAYDMILAKRLHPATALGLCFMLAAQGTMFLVWGSSLWRQFAFAAVHAIRASL
ncbi:MAG TPA: hypothetical protein VGG69_01215 [Rhizomicrobium sp.]|jgi:hypothetical protein